MSAGKRPRPLPMQGAPFMNAKSLTAGHSYNTIGAPPDRMWNNRLAFSLGGTPIFQLGIGGANFLLGEQTAGKKSGGWATLAQNMLKVTNPALSAPSIAPQPFLAVETTGLNDVPQIAAMTGSPTTGNQKTAIDCYADTQRATLALLSSGVFLEAETAFSTSSILTTFTNAAGSAGTNAGSWTSPTGTQANSGAGWRQTTATGDKVIHGPTTIGSTIEYGNARYVDMFFLCPGFGASIPGSVITFTNENGTQIYPEGYPSGTPFDTSTVRPQYATVGFTTVYWKVARFKVAAGAGRQIIASAGVGGMAVDLITYESDFPPPILWHNIARTPGIAGDAAKLAVLDALNVRTEAIVKEFNSPFIRHLDLDACLKYGDPGNVYGMWNVAVDTTHPGEPGQRAISAMDYEALASMPLVPAQSVTLGGGLDAAMLPAVDLVALTNITLSGSSAADGVTPQTGFRVLCTAQTNQAQNGPWVVDTGFNWVRPLDFVTGQNGAGKTVMVRSGGNTIAGGTVYGVTSSTNVIIDTTAHTWTKITGPLSGSSVDGATLELSGSTLQEKDGGTTNAKLANMATKTYKGRTSGGTGAPEDVSAATLATDLASQAAFSATYAPLTTVLTKTGGGLDTVNNLGNITGATTANLANGNMQYGTLTGNVTFTFSGATNGSECEMVLSLTQDGTGSRTITWPASVKWAGGVGPTISTAASANDQFVFRTRDGGTTWYGALIGKGFA